MTLIILFSVYCILRRNFNSTFINQRQFTETYTGCHLLSCMVLWDLPPRVSLGIWNIHLSFPLQKKQVSATPCYISTKLCGVLFQKTIVFIFTAVRRKECNLLLGNFQCRYNVVQRLSHVISKQNITTTVYLC